MKKQLAEDEGEQNKQEAEAEQVSQRQETAADMSRREHNAELNLEPLDLDFKEIPQDTSNCRNSASHQISNLSVLPG